MLGLEPSASSREIVAAFRRLAKRYHPDVNRSAAARRRFIQIVEAYSTLRGYLRLRSPPGRWGLCPRCRRHADLFEPLAGGLACASCLLGQTARSRFFPLPDVVVAQHVAVLALYAACLALLVLYLHTGETMFAAFSLLCVLNGLFVLAAEALWIVWSDRPRPPHAARPSPRAVV